MHKSTLKAIGVIAMAALVAIATAIGTGLGGRVLALFEPEQVLSSSATEEIYECGTQLFVRQPTAAKIVSGDVSAEPEWTSFHRRHKAAVAEQSVVEVSIQGESSRKITLTRIEFEVRRQKRPAGALFSNACGDAVIGRFVQLDLDRRPPAIVGSTADPEGIVGAVDPEGRGSFRAIKFPWTVSITDPLLLKVVATTKRCLCNWRGYITWRSGGETGRIPIDNAGKGYTVAGISGLRHFSRIESQGRWQAIRVAP